MRYAHGPNAWCASYVLAEWVARNEAGLLAALNAARSKRVLEEQAAAAALQRAGSGAASSLISPRSIAGGEDLDTQPSDADPGAGEGMRIGCIAWLG
jgi:hypothetical protein